MILDYLDWLGKTNAIAAHPQGTSGWQGSVPFLSMGEEWI